MCGHILQAYFRLKRGFFGGHCLSVLNWCAMTRGVTHRRVWNSAMQQFSSGSALRVQFRFVCLILVRRFFCSDLSLHNETGHHGRLSRPIRLMFAIVMRVWWQIIRRYLALRQPEFQRNIIIQRTNLWLNSGKSATNGMDYDFQFSSAYFDREKNCRKNDMTRSDSFIKEIKAQFDTQEQTW